MASVNKVIILGNLGQDPQIREANGKIVANLSVATTRKYKAQDGQWMNETEWHRVTFFGRTAEVCRDYLKKGSPAYIEGRIRTRKYKAQDGSERSATEIVGESLQLLSAAGSGKEQRANFESSPRPRAPVSSDVNDSEVPF